MVSDTLWLWERIMHFVSMIKPGRDPSTVQEDVPGVKQRTNIQQKLHKGCLDVRCPSNMACGIYP